MKGHAAHVLLAAIATMAVACDSSPTAPQLPGQGPPWLIQFLEWDFPNSSTTTVTLTGSWVARVSPSADITTLASWESTAPDVLAIAGPGRLVRVAPGDAEVRVTFRGFSTTHHMRVFESEPPWPVYKAGESREFNGAVRNESAAGIGGARVEVVGGHNAGIVVTTDESGRYTLRPPLVCGPITVQVTSAGYEDATASSVMCLESLPNVVMKTR